MDLSGLRIREAARGLLLTPDNRVLLVRFEFPDGGTHWALPGGGLDPGEDHETALRRELDEELGILDVDIGPHVWTRLHLGRWEGWPWDGQRERIYLVRTEMFEPKPRLSWKELNEEFLFEIRWFHAEEIKDGLPFTPATLGSRLRQLIARGPPVDPIDVEV